MTLILIIDALVIAILVGTVLTKDFERCLPTAAFLLLLFPNECQIRIPGLLEITTQRIVVMTLLVLFVIFGRSRNRPLALKHLVLLQLMWMFISTLHSVVFVVSLKTFLSQFLDYFLPFYIFARSVTRMSTIHKTIVAFVAAITVCCVFGAFEAYGSGNIVAIFPSVAHSFGDRRFEADRGIRVMSTFGHSILFGAALSMAIPQSLYLLAITRQTAHKAVLWIGVMLMFLNVYKTGSRAAWMATVLSIAILFIFGLKKFRRYVVGIALLSLTVLVVRPGVWETINNNYTATLDPESPQGSSYQWRYALYRIAVRELSKDAGRTLWGYGPESFIHLKLEGEFLGRSVPFESCDSSIAQIMIEQGYVGLAITAMRLFQGLANGFRTARRISAPNNLLPLVLLTNFVAFSFMMTNVALFGWGQQTYLFWISLAFIMMYPTLAKKAALSRPLPVMIEKDLIAQNFAQA